MAPDISMCLNNKCKSRKKCYRFMATPEKKWQSYAGFNPEKGDSRCGMFVPLVPVKEETPIRVCHA